MALDVTSSLKCTQISLTFRYFPVFLFVTLVAFTSGAHKILNYICCPVDSEQTTNEKIMRIFNLFHRISRFALTTFSLMLLLFGLATSTCY